MGFTSKPVRVVEIPEPASEPLLAPEREPERPNSPVVIAATNNGVAFNPLVENQRAGLLLANGILYITWASHCDGGAYKGWIIGYYTTNLLKGRLLPRIPRRPARRQAFG